MFGREENFFLFNSMKVGKGKHFFVQRQAQL